MTPQPAQPLLRIASRRSLLARAQTRLFLERLYSQQPHMQGRCTVTTMRSTLSPSMPKARFTKTLNDAVIAHSIDCAVHSLKDMPARLEPPLVIACFLPREDASDALLMAPPMHARLKGTIPRLRDIRPFFPPSTPIRLGTSSLRRKAQLQHVLPHSTILPITGNIDSRLRHLTGQGEPIDGIILATAGLKRLRMDHHITLPIAKDDMLPAAGQGILAVVCRHDDKDTRCLLAPLNDEESSLCAQTEFAVLRGVGASCHAPIGVHATITRQHKERAMLCVRAFLGDETGALSWQLDGTCPATLSDGQRLGHHIGTQLRQTAGKTFAQRYLQDIT